jgi:hypothetical protein
MKNMNKINLKNTTLISFNCVDPIQSVKALLYSSRKIDFADMIIVSNQKPQTIPEGIRHVSTDAVTHRDSCQWTYTGLPYLVDTEYCLFIHDDGFVINPHLWNHDWLQYDYIGAPWKNYGQRNRVGNGGFCFRSKKFLDLVKKISYRGTHCDTELSNDYYDYFVQNGCRYAPVEVAMKFSLESRIPECEYNLDNCFGFHGRGHMDTTSVHDGYYQQFQEKCKLLDTVII